MENIIELLIGFRDKAVVTRGFLDTGNNLYDRVTGKPIVVAAPDIIKKLYSKTYGSILSFFFFFSIEVISTALLGKKKIGIISRTGYT